MVKGKKGQVKGMVLLVRPEIVDLFFCFASAPHLGSNRIEVLIQIDLHN